jgi:PKD repeat protein
LPTTVVHTYTASGSYYPRVQVWNNTGGYLGEYSGSYIQVNGVSSINAPDSACLNDQVQFCPNSQANSCSWNFGDGNTSTDYCPSHAYTTLGTKTVTLVANTSCGTYTVTRSIVVSTLTKPHPNAWTHNNTVCPNYPVSFDANSFSTYLWNFGDGATSTLQRPQHSYTATGTYTATLTVTNACGNQGSTNTIVTISSTAGFPGSMGIGSSPNASCPGQPVNNYVYNGDDFVKYLWNFGDGSPKDSLSGTNVNHTYTATGTYSVSCKVTNQCSQVNTYTNTVTISNTVPFPNQSWFQLTSNAPSCPGSNVNFNAPNGYNNYLWNFGDGSPAVASSNNWNNHTYPNTITTYTASVKITSPCGNDTTIKTVVQITNNAPWGYLNQFYASSPSCPNSTVGFQAPCGFNSYQWNFGDGSPLSTTSDCSAQHPYGSALTTYTVSVKITNGCGKDTTLYTTMQTQNNVGFPNQSWFSFQAGPSPACPNTDIWTYAPSSYVSYVWNFGDGSPAITTTSNSTHHLYGSTITTYTLSVKITNACGRDTTIYTTLEVKNGVHFPNNDQNFKLGVYSSPSCPNSTVSFNGPSGYSNYEWNFGDGSPHDFTTNSYVNHTYGSTITTYTVSVKVVNGCGNDTTVYSTVEIKNNVGFPTNNFMLYANPSIACPNDQMNWSAPNGYVSYNWTFGDGNSVLSTQGYANHTYTAVGTYTTSVKITNTCGKDTTIYGTVVINTNGSFSDYLKLEVSPNSSSCPNDLIYFRVDKGFQSYSWNFGDGNTSTSTGGDMQHSYSVTGTYTASCTVTNGCNHTKTLYANVYVSNNAPVSTNTTIDRIPNPSCAGDEVFFMIKQGQSSYTYVWNFGDGSPLDTSVGAGTSHTYTAIGTYTVTAAIKNGCGSTRTVTVTENVTNSVVPTLTDSHGQPMWGFPGCESGSTAGCAGDAIIFYFFGSAANNVWHFGDGDSGTATQQMLVYGGDGVMPITVIMHAYSTNGTYTVSLKITNNCGNSVTSTMNVTIGGNMAVNGDMTTSPPPFTTCAPVNFIGFGGSNYAFDFGDGNTLNTSSPTVSHTYATQGIYVVNCVITNGCGNSATYTRSINVNGVGGPSITLFSSTNPTCDNGTDGQASVTVSSGQAPYQYLWNDANAQTTSSATGLSGGLYNVTVTDNIGCSSVMAVSITDPASIVLASSTTKSSCGGATGTATVTVTSGGTAPYSYQWVTGATTSSVTGLGVGQYAVNITDAHGCTSTTNVSISEQNGATLSTNTVTNTSCYGGSNGSIDMNVTGGNAPFTYAWSNGSTTQDISNLAAGSYSVTVTDNSGCKGTYNTTITQPAAIAVVASVVTSPTCGNFDGKATATVTGGTGAYTYMWDVNAGSQTTQVASNLPAGSYTILVTDSKGCTNNGIVSLSNSNAPNITSVITNVSCFGGSNGSIDLTVTGGTSPYSYGWSNGAHTQDVNGLSPNSYFVSIGDYKGCTSFSLFTITQPALLTSSVTNTGATCNNNDGTATVTPAGGTSPYTYAWNSTPAQSTQAAANLALGNYTVSVTDSKGCTTSSTATITATTTERDICIVTVDSTSTKNVIVWEKPAVTNIDSFLIYRDIASVYTKVGSVDFTAPSQFVDNTTGVNPNLTSYRYKIKALDNCGGVSSLSTYHKTIHLQVSLGAPSGYQLNWDDYLGMTISQYRILRDTNNLGNWVPIDSVPFGITSYTDLTPWDSVRYMIEIDHANGCVISSKNPVPMATNLNSSRSNVYRMNGNVTHAGNYSDELFGFVYPNPSNGVFTVGVNNPEIFSVKVFNVLGEVIRSMTSTGKNKITVDLSRESRGVYYVQLSAQGKMTTKKIIIK